MIDLSELLKDKKTEYLDVADSTNTLLKKRASLSGSENTVLITEHQTAGRGRLGKTFFSPRGCGIYFSYLIKPELSLSDGVFITVAAAVSMTRALARIFGIDTKIKWVNDIYFGDKKLCGILTESSALPCGKLSYAVLGLGINLKNPPGGYPEDFAYKTTNLENIVGEVSSEQKALLICEFIREFDRLIADFTRSYIKEYKEKSCLLGREIEILSGEHRGSGIALDIDENANLVVKASSGETVALSSGDVSIKFR